MADRSGQLAPGGRFRFQSLLTSWGQLVILRAAAIFAYSPMRRDPTAAFQAVQRRIERTLLDLQRFTRDLL